MTLCSPPGSPFPGETNIPHISSARRQNQRGIYTKDRNPVKVQCCQTLLPHTNGCSYGHTFPWKSLDGDSGLAMRHSSDQGRAGAQLEGGSQSLFSPSIQDFPLFGFSRGWQRAVPAAPPSPYGQHLVFAQSPDPVYILPHTAVSQTAISR